MIQKELFKTLIVTQMNINYEINIFKTQLSLLKFKRVEIYKINNQFRILICQIIS